MAALIFYAVSYKQGYFYLRLYVACKQALGMGYSEICFRMARGRARERACNNPCTI